MISTISYTLYNYDGVYLCMCNMSGIMRIEISIIVISNVVFPCPKVLDDDDDTDADENGDHDSGGAACDDSDDDVKKRMMIGFERINKVNMRY